MSTVDTRGAPERPVLIVGCGPTGMTAALALSRLGIESLVIERRMAISESPRAHALNCRTLEILAQLGVDIGALRELGTPDAESGWVRWVDTLDGGEFGALPYERIPTPETVPTPFPLFNIAQPDVETLLFEHLQADDNIRIERGWEWLDCEQHAAGVTSRVRDAAGHVVDIDSQYVIAADGANSPVRLALGIPMEGPGVIQRFKTVHFRADLSDLVADKPAILYWVLDQACAGTLIAYDIRDNWVFMYPCNDPTVDPATIADEVCLAATKAAIGVPDVELEVFSIRDWEMTSEVAASYRRDRVFLAGDAAHRYPPSGGLGLNTGVGDAHNLAWKIAGVLAGWSPDSILATYDSERRPVASQNAAFSLENAMKMLDVFNHAGVFAERGTQPGLDAIRADEQRWEALQASIQDQRVHFDGLPLHLGAHYGRDEAPDWFAERVQQCEVGARLPHVWLQRDGERVSSLELLSPAEFTLLLGPGVQGRAFAFDLPLQVLSCPDDFSAAGADLEELGIASGAVLVRPDGHIAGLFPSIAGIDGAIERVVERGLAA